MIGIPETAGIYPAFSFERQAKIRITSEIYFFPDKKAKAIGHMVRRGVESQVVREGHLEIAEMAAFEYLFLARFCIAFFCTLTDSKKEHPYELAQFLRTMFQDRKFGYISNWIIPESEMPWVLH